MTDTPQDPPLAKVIKLAMAEARGEGDAAASYTSPTDRVLVILTLLGVAIVIAWPRERPVPPAVLSAYKFGQDLWNRRGWWVG